jgi:hypothetical protein
VKKQIAELLVELKAPGTGVEIKDRRYFLKKHPQCFVASELIDWFRTKKNLPYAEALDKCKMLFDGGVIAHVNHQHVFEDGNLLFRFTDEQLMAASASAALPSAVSMANCNQLAMDLIIPRMFVNSKCYAVIEQGNLYLFENRISPAPYAHIAVDKLTLSNDRPAVGGKLVSFQLIAEDETLDFAATSFEDSQSFINALLHSGMSIPAGQANANLMLTTYDFTPKFNDEVPKCIGDYRGKVLYVVNVASF